MKKSEFCRGLTEREPCLPAFDAMAVSWQFGSIEKSPANLSKVNSLAKPRTVRFLSSHEVRLNQMAFEPSWLAIVLVPGLSERKRSCLPSRCSTVIRWNLRPRRTTEWVHGEGRFAKSKLHGKSPGPEETHRSLQGKRCIRPGPPVVSRPLTILAVQDFRGNARVSLTEMPPSTSSVCPVT